MLFAFRFDYIEGLTLMEKPIGKPDSDSSAGIDSALADSIYSELRLLARKKMVGEAPQTLSATALAHEAWLTLSEKGEADAGKWENRRHFFGAAAEAMRRILINRARAKAAIKRGGNMERADLAISQIAIPEGKDADEILAVCEAMDEFAKVDPECAELVRLKYIIGLSWEEISEMTETSTRTLRRRWTYAKAWLYEALQGTSIE